MSLLETTIRKWEICISIMLRSIISCTDKHLLRPFHNGAVSALPASLQSCHCCKVGLNRLGEEVFVIGVAPMGILHIVLKKKNCVRLYSAKPQELDSKMLN